MPMPIRSKWFTVVLLICLLLYGLVHAQPVAEFSLVNVVDGKTISLNNFGKQPGVVIIFTSVTCPFDLSYQDRIRSMADTYASRIPFLLVNAHTDADESAESMKKFAHDNNLKIPYLDDKQQVLMNSLSARRSPEAFVLKNSNGIFTIAYRGAIDDNPQVATDVSQPYLSQAIDDVLSGKTPATRETRPAGCSIRRN